MDLSNKSYICPVHTEYCTWVALCMTLNDSYLCTQSVGLSRLNRNVVPSDCRGRHTLGKLRAGRP